MEKINLDLITKVKNTAFGAAYKSADIISSLFCKNYKITKKGAIDLATEADFKSEEIIISTIHKAFPEHAILAEESGLEQRNINSDFLWIIDPLDGTLNFAHGIPVFAVSIALAHKTDHKTDILVGIVFNPITKELFSAVKNQGAYLNNNLIYVSNHESPLDCMIATGFPYDIFESNINILVSRFYNCLKICSPIRRLGSAAIDLCYVACGKFDGFWEQNLKPWDTAAGYLIAQEAGAKITDFSGNFFDIYKKEILATNGKIHDLLIQALNLQPE